MGRGHGRSAQVPVRVSRQSGEDVHTGSAQVHRVQAIVGEACQGVIIVGGGHRDHIAQRVGAAGYAGVMSLFDELLPAAATKSMS